MKFDKEIFLSNVRQLTDAHCGRVEKSFNKKIGQRDALTRWKKPGINPNFDAITKICETFHCSFDWLLTGREAGNERRPDSLDQWPEEIREKIDRVIRAGAIAELGAALDFILTVVGGSEELIKKIAELEHRVEGLVHLVNRPRRGIPRAREAGEKSESA